MKPITLFLIVELKLFDFNNQVLFKHILTLIIKLYWERFQHKNIIYLS